MALAPHLLLGARSKTLGLVDILFIEQEQSTLLEELATHPPSNILTASLVVAQNTQG
jgi:hypothetical protein